MTRSRQVATNRQRVNPLAVHLEPSAQFGFVVRARLGCVTRPITWVSEVMAVGFKRLDIRISDVPPDLRDLVRDIREIASIVDSE
jgi:hypothetical protein